MNELNRPNIEKGNELSGENKTQLNELNRKTIRDQNEPVNLIIKAIDMNMSQTIRVCRICGQQLPTNKHAAARVCSTVCAKKLFSIKQNLAKKHWITMAEVTEEMIQAKVMEIWYKVCPVCKTPLGMCNTNRIYCSDKCRGKAAKMRK